MDISSGSWGDFRRLALSGQFWRQEDMDTLEAYVTTSIRARRPWVVLDLDGLSFVNSRGLGLFVRLHNRCAEAGGRLILFQPRSSVRDVIDVSDLRKFIAVADTPAELDALGASCVAGEGEGAATAP